VPSEFGCCRILKRVDYGNIVLWAGMTAVLTLAAVGVNIAAIQPAPARRWRSQLSIMG
jgi:hypothetical protein